MKFYLVKDKCRIFVFGNEESEDGPTLNARISWRYRLVSGNIIPLKRHAKETEKCAILKHKIEKYYNANSEEPKRCPTDPIFLLSQPSPWSMDLLVGVSGMSNESGTHLKGYIKLTGIFAGNCLLALCQLSDHEAKVQIKCTAISPPPHLTPICTFTTKEMRIAKEEIFECEDHDVLFPVDYFRHWMDDSLLVELTITVTIPNQAVTETYVSSRGISLKTTSISKKILETEMLSDVTIVANNEAHIKAHRAFLAVRSPVFLAMFENDMKESRESTVTLPDMSEESVKALLRYVYYGDLTAASNSCIVAFELYSAAHRYNVDLLEDVLSKLILTKPAAWYDETDVAVKFFLLARNLTPVNEDLKIKAIAVLKKHTGSLESCSSFLEMFENDQEATMEFIKYALSN